MPKKRKLRDVWVLPCKGVQMTATPSRASALGECRGSQRHNSGLFSCATCPTKGPVRYGPKGGPE